MINIYDLNVKFKNRKVFSHNYFSFSDIGITWLKGSSGSGKTTLLKVILNKVNYQGICVIDESTYSLNTMITSKKVFGILSDDYLLINKTIEENIMFYYPDASIDVITNFLAKYNLKNCFNICLKKLSRGQIDLVKVLLTILSDADYYLFDEIISSFDRENKILILEDLKKISLSKGIIFSSHDQEIASFSDNIIDLEKDNHEIKEIENYNIFKETSKKTNYTFNSFSFLKAIIFLLISIISLDFITINHEFDDFLQKNEIAIYNDNISFPCNKNNIETFFNECPSLIGLRTESKSIRSFMYNNYFDLRLMPQNPKQNNVYSDIDDSLENYELLISDKIYNYLTTQVKNYGFKELEINNLSYYNFSIIGVYHSDYYEIKMNTFSFYKGGNVYDYPIYLSNKYDVPFSFNKYIDNQTIEFFYDYFPLEQKVQFIDENAIYINSNDYDALDKLLTKYYSTKTSYSYYFFPFSLEKNLSLASGTLPVKENEILLPSYLKNSKMEENLINKNFKVTGYYKYNSIFKEIRILTCFTTYFTNEILSEQNLEEEVIFRANNILESQAYFNDKGYDVLTFDKVHTIKYKINDYIVPIIIFSSIITFFQLLSFAYDEIINRKNIFVSLLKNQSIHEKQKEKCKKLLYDYIFSIFIPYSLTLIIILISAYRFNLFIYNTLLYLIIISAILLISSLVYLIISLIVIRKIKYIYLKN